MQHDLKTKTLDILDACQDLTIATVREDGFPQATTVSFVHDGLEIYIGVGITSQKAVNMRRDPRVSLAMTPPYSDWNTITGLSMAAHATEIDTQEEMDRVGDLMIKRFPQIADLSAPEEMAAAILFRLTPTVISVLDYSQGFGHTDTVAVANYDIAESLESMKHKWLVPVT
jgi:nitroimidazol reductase NimA-like FMN-containing flavoprotein (pyridoxamine 5'-phosphate oxidase superfamily)